MRAQSADVSDQPAALPRPGTVAVVDGTMSGHHTTYLRLVTKMLLELGARVLILCPEPLKIETWLAAQTVDGACMERFGSAPFRLPPRPRPRNRLDGLAAYLRRWHAVAHAIRRHDPSPARTNRLVLFLWLDDFLSSARYISLISPWLLPLVFRHPWAGLFFRPHQLRPAPGGAGRHPYSALRLASCRRVFIHDEARLAALGEDRAAAKARRFPEFTDESPPRDGYPLIDEIRTRACGRAVISALGALAKRKGILTLLEAALSNSSQPWFFLFAGELMEQHFEADELARLRELSANPPENCCFSFKYIPDEPSFNALVSASDVLYAAYRNFHHSGNILTKAALFEKPVIVSRGYLMEERVRRFKLGTCIAQDNVAECAAALRMLSDPSRFRQEVGEPRFDGYLRLHSSACFRQELSELLGEER